MWSATGGEEYDFKVTNGGETSLFSTPEQYYRGMPILDKINDLPVFASARDVGNIAAGIVAARSGLAWEVARIGLDGLESAQQGEFTSEGTSTQFAQKLGHRIGEQIYQKEELSRLPGNGHLNGVKVSKDIIRK